MLVIVFDCAALLSTLSATEWIVSVYSVITAVRTLVIVEIFFGRDVSETADVAMPLSFAPSSLVLARFIDRFLDCRDVFDRFRRIFDGDLDMFHGRRRFFGSGARSEVDARVVGSRICEGWSEFEACVDCRSSGRGLRKVCNR